MTAPRRWLLGLTVALLALALAVQALALLDATWGFTTDDAYISLRYARHLVAGEGLRWNVGEAPVEGYSNFSFVLAGAAALAAGFDPVLVLKLLGAASMLGVLLLLPAFEERGARAALGLAAGFLWLRYPWVPIWSASGFETATYALVALAALALAGGGADALERAEPARARRALALAGVLVLVAALTRPEGPLVGVAIAAGAVAEGVRRRPGTTDGRRAGWRRTWAIVAPVALVSALPYALYLGFKLAWFGDLIPNSVRCKAIFDGDPWALLRDALPLIAWTLPLAALALAWKPDQRRVGLAAFAALSLAILHGADPILGHGNRHALAAYAALVALGVAGAAELAARALPRLGAPVRAAVLLVIAAALGLSALEPRLRLARQTAEAYSGREGARRELAAWLEARYGGEARFVLGDCGVLGYFTRARIVDALCLNSREMPRDPIRRDPEAFARFVFERPPEVVVLSSSRPDRLAPRPDYGVYPALARHPAFESQYRLGAIFGRPGDDLVYWTFERQAAVAGAVADPAAARSGAP